MMCVYPVEEVLLPGALVEMHCMQIGRAAPAPWSGETARKRGYFRAQSIPIGLKGLVCSFSGAALSLLDDIPTLSKLDE